MEHIFETKIEPRLVALEADTRHPEMGLYDIDWLSTLEKFKKQRPTEFTGVTKGKTALENACAAQHWVKKMEKIFDPMKCSDALKQRLGAFQLTDDAATWWESASRSKDTDSMNWEEFKDMFYQKYIPPSARKELKKMFLDLKQGERSVVEYETKFDRLSLFAPEDMDTDEKRKDRFIEGLNDVIARYLENMAIKTYVEATDCARRHDYRVEQYRKKRSAEKVFSQGKNGKSADLGTTSSTKFAFGSDLEKVMHQQVQKKFKGHEGKPWNQQNQQFTPSAGTTGKFKDFVISATSRVIARWSALIRKINKGRVFKAMGKGKPVITRKPTYRFRANRGSLLYQRHQTNICRCIRSNNNPNMMTECMHFCLRMRIFQKEQLEAVQEFGKHGPGLNGSSCSAVAVLITKADLKGYHDI